MRSMSKLGMALVLVLVMSAVAQEGEDAAYLQMRRTACLVLSRYHSNTQKETIEAVVQALPPTDQNRYINKLYAVAVLACEESISQSEVQEVPSFPFSSMSITPTSIPQASSTYWRVWTTLPSPTIWALLRIRTPSSSSPRSSTRRCRSSRRRRRPRASRRVVLRSVTR